VTNLSKSSFVIGLFLQASWRQIEIGSFGGLSWKIYSMLSCQKSNLPKARETLWVVSGIRCNSRLNWLITK